MPDPAQPAYPALYQVNTRVWLMELGRTIGRPATLDDIPDTALDGLAAAGYDWIWLLSVWQTGAASRQVSLDDPGLRATFQRTLPDLREEDIAGSGFAITGYTVAMALGGEAALARLRARLRERGLRLMLDLVPNHTALDHPWVEAHPDYYVPGSELDLLREPGNYRWVHRAGGDVLLAHGRDPYFAGWTDTLQLDYANPALQRAMADELVSIAAQCDGVRCDMAMLILPDVFERTWGRQAPPFWGHAIARTREAHPGFLFMAEVYWDLEWTMLQQGFDYAYDKRLYDRLRNGAARPVREHLWADLEYQRHLARFLENHDEPRAAATFPPGQHQAAAVITFLTPGLRFLHAGQLEGRRVHVSPHLVRAPDEPVDQVLAAFYARLLPILRQPVVRDGAWRLLDCVSAWDGEGTVDGFIAWTWEGGGARLVVAVNYAGAAGRCYVRLPFDDLAGRSIRFTDLLGDAVYDRNGDDLLTRGLYLDVPAWHVHVFEVSPAAG